MTPSGDDDYYKSLPRKRASGGVLMFNGDKILFVETTYKDTLEIPGGVVEAGESPLAAAGRECREELGVTIDIKRLLCMDYCHGDKTTGDATHFIFLGDLGGQKITPDNVEIKSVHWLTLAEALPRLSKPLAARVAAAAAAVKSGQTVYCEEGKPPFAPPAQSVKAPPAQSVKAPPVQSVKAPPAQSVKTPPRGPRF